MKDDLKSSLIDVLWVVSSRNGTNNNGTNEKVGKTDTCFPILGWGFGVWKMGLRWGFWVCTGVCGVWGWSWRWGFKNCGLEVWKNLTSVCHFYRKNLTSVCHFYLFFYLCHYYLRHFYMCHFNLKSFWVQQAKSFHT